MHMCMGYMCPFYSWRIVGSFHTILSLSALLPDTGSLTEPGVRLVASKSQPSSCHHSPHVCDHVQLFTRVLGSQAWSPFLYNEHLYSLSHLSTSFPFLVKICIRTQKLLLSSLPVVVNLDCSHIQWAEAGRSL